MSMVREAIACFPEKLWALYFPQEFGRGDSYGALRYRSFSLKNWGRSISPKNLVRAIAWVFLKNWGRSISLNNLEGV